jgi:hypothetical protein
LFIDKDWRALSWLLSAKAREEQKYEAVQFAVMRTPGAKNLHGPAWDDAKLRKALELGFELVDTKLMPDDPALTAIEGRGPRDPRLAEIGYGGRVFLRRKLQIYPPRSTTSRTWTCARSSIRR